jgi:hypothetical protein
MGGNWSQPKISRIETAAQAIAPGDVRTWAGLLLDDEQAVEELVDQAWAVATQLRSYRVSLAEGHAARQASYGELEQAARQLRMFQHYVVPGLLQTYDYARALFRIAHPVGQARDGAPEAAANARVARQVILDDESRRFEWVVTEAALYWRPGPWDEQAEQVRAVLQVTSRPNVDIRLIPLGAQATTFYHSFTLFDDALVYVETVTGEGRTDEPGGIAHAADVFERLRSSALSPEATRARLSSLADDFAKR